MERALLIGLDTNVLLRFMVQDDLAQTSLVQTWLDKRSTREPGFVPILVLCEFVWVLTTRYRFPRAEIASAITAILNTEVLIVERAALVQTALQQFRDSRADFADCCIAALATTAGCSYTLTFDQAAAKLPGMRLLSNA